MCEYAAEVKNIKYTVFFLNISIYVTEMLSTITQPIIFTNQIDGTTAIITSGGTTLMTTASNKKTVLMGTSAHTVILPEAGQTVNGSTYTFINKSTQPVTINTATISTEVVTSEWNYPDPDNVVNTVPGYSISVKDVTGFTPSGSIVINGNTVNYTSTGISTSTIGIPSDGVTLVDGPQNIYVTDTFGVPVPSGIMYVSTSLGDVKMNYSGVSEFITIASISGNGSFVTIVTTAPHGIPNLAYGGTAEPYYAYGLITVVNATTVTIPETGNLGVINSGYIYVFIFKNCTFAGTPVYGVLSSGGLIGYGGAFIGCTGPSFTATGTVTQSSTVTSILPDTSCDITRITNAWDLRNYPRVTVMDNAAAITYPTSPQTEGVWYGTGTKGNIGGSTSVLIGNNAASIGIGNTVVLGSGASTSVAGSTVIGYGASVTSDTNTLGFSCNRYSLSSNSLGLALSNGALSSSRQMEVYPSLWSNSSSVSNQLSVSSAAKTQYYSAPGATVTLPPLPDATASPSNLPSGATYKIINNTGAVMNIIAGASTTYLSGTVSGTPSTIGVRSAIGFTPTGTFIANSNIVTYTGLTTLSSTISPGSNGAVLNGGPQEILLSNTTGWSATGVVSINTSLGNAIIKYSGLGVIRSVFAIESGSGVAKYYLFGSPFVVGDIVSVVTTFPYQFVAAANNATIIATGVNYFAVASVFTYTYVNNVATATGTGISGCTSETGTVLRGVLSTGGAVTAYTAFTGCTGPIFTPSGAITQNRAVGQIPTGTAEVTCVDINGTSGINGWYMTSSSAIGGFANNYAYAYDNTVQTIIAADTWYDVTFAASNVFSWVHTPPSTSFTCSISGRYRIVATVNFNKTATNVEAGIRLTLNGVTITSSVQHYHLHTSATDHLTALLEVQAQINAGDILRVQVAADTGGSTVTLLPITTLTFSGQPSARLSITPV